MRIISLLLLFFTIVGIAGCKKSSKENSGPSGTPPVDPAVANTIGFFLNDWQAKSFTIPAYKDTSTATAAASIFVNLDASTITTKIPNSIFGQNANIWMTQMVTEP